MAAEAGMDGIREALSLLTEVKDALLRFWAGQEMDPAVRSMAAQDAEAACAAAGRACDQLERAVKGDGPDALSAAQRALGAAEHAMAAAATALASPRLPEEARVLEARWSEAFAACRDRMSGVAEGLSPPAPGRPAATAFKVGPEEFALLCGICGRPAGSVRVGKRAGRGPGWDGEGVLVEGGGFMDTFGLAHSVAVFGLLGRGDAAGLHRFIWELQRSLKVEMYGLRCFCPECGEVLCGRHYRVVPVYEAGGFYDSSTAICPQGHKREIDD